MSDAPSTGSQTRSISWQQHDERGSGYAMRLLRFAALKLGRAWVRPFLYPLSLYFTLTSRITRRVSREFLARVLPKPPTFADVWRHVFAFTSISLDRIFLLTGSHRFDVVDHYAPGTLELARARGALMFVAHFGSFEVMRAGAVKDHGLKLHMVLDVNIGRQFMATLTELDPDFAAHIIDSSNRDLDLVMRVRDALAAGSVVGLMVDRARAGDRTVTANFLGSEAQFPAGPWLLAAALKVPVMLVFGTWHGGNRYEAHVEILADSLELPRVGRDAALTRLVQGYADRLAGEVRSAPYNWLNFFDFWAR